MGRGPFAGRNASATDGETSHALTVRLARVRFAPGVAEDFDRFIEHMVRFNVRNPAVRIREITRATRILGRSPLMGRPAGEVDRELLIGLRSHSYVALYRFDANTDTVLVIAICSQREDGYKRGK